MKSTRFWRNGLMCCATIFLASCTKVNSKLGQVVGSDTDLKLQVVSAAMINPDERDQSSPVFIRLYELTSTKAFEQASFIDLYERDAEVLGDSMVAKQELHRVVPGTERVETFVLSADTRYVGLFAEFFRYKDADAKEVFEVTPSNLVRNTVKVKISGNSVVLMQ